MCIIVVLALLPMDDAQAMPLSDFTASNPSMVSINGDCATFSYQYSEVTKTISVNGIIASGAVATVNVSNLQDNTIGNSGSTVDRYKVAFRMYNGDSLVEDMTYDRQELETQNVTLQSGYTGYITHIILLGGGIDNGYWAGFYGPTMCSPTLTYSLVTPTPTPTPSPSPSETATPQLTPTPEPTATPETSSSPSPTPSLSPVASPSPAVEEPQPTPQPTPTVSPSSEPSPSPSVATPSPTSESTSTATPSPQPSVTPTPQPTQTQQPEPSTPAPTPVPSPTPSPEPLPTPDPVPQPNTNLPPVVEPTPILIPEPEPSTEPLPIADPEPIPLPEPEPPIKIEPPLPPIETELEPPIVPDENTEMPPIEEPLPPAKEPNSNLPLEPPLPPEIAPEPTPEIPIEEVTAETWEPLVAPEEYLSEKEIKTYEEIGLVPNNPKQLPTDIPKPAPVEILVIHIQQDVAGVENGGIEFFGTQSQPQVVGEDGQLTPPAPAPGSGDPIPPDAITTEDTFIGQAGGVTFNSPDIAVPVEPIEINIDIPAVGETVQAMADAYVALANVGNDMSPITRKKAKKILLGTIIVGQIMSYRRK